MKDLMLHCGGELVDWNTIEMTPTPDSTDTWTPIPHAQLITTIKDTLIRGGLDVINEQHGLAKNGLRYFGIMQLVNDTDSEDHSTILGIRNSHDKKFTAGLTVGAGVFVCDNLSFSGEVTIARKHTRNINSDLPRLVETAVGKIGKARRTQEHWFAAYKRTKIKDAQVHDLVIQALDVKAICTTYIPKIIQEWREPTHEEFTVDGKSLWRLFNACTGAHKRTRPETLAPRTMALHGLLDSFAGIAV